MSEKLWAVQDLSDHTGVPVKTIYNWRSQGKGPRAIKVGRHLRFRPADVEAWLDTQADAV